VTESVLSRRVPCVPTRRSSDLGIVERLADAEPYPEGVVEAGEQPGCGQRVATEFEEVRGGADLLVFDEIGDDVRDGLFGGGRRRSEEHTSERQSREKLVCRLLL